MSEEPVIPDPNADTREDARLAEHVAYAEEPYRVGAETAKELGELATEESMHQLMGEAAAKAKQLYYETEATERITESYKPEYEASRDSADITRQLTQEAIDTERKTAEQTKQEFDFLKEFGRVLPPLKADISIKPVGNAEGVVDIKEVYFDIGDDLHLAGVLSTETVWQGSRNPFFIIGSRKSKDGMIDVLLLSPTQRADISKAESDSGIKPKRWGFYGMDSDQYQPILEIEQDLAEPQLRITRMKSKHFKSLMQEQDSRRNAELSEAEASSVLESHRWPSNKGRKLMLDGYQGVVDSAIDLAMGRPEPDAEQNMYFRTHMEYNKFHRDNIKQVSVGDILSMGGFQQFDIDSKISVLAVALDSTDKLLELKRAHPDVSL